MLHFGVASAAVALGIAMWVMVFGLLGYATCDWCPYLCKLFLDCGNLSSFLLLQVSCSDNTLLILFLLNKVQILFIIWCCVLLQPGKLVLQNTAINDGVLEE